MLTLTMNVCIFFITWPLDSSKLEAVSNALLLIWSSISLIPGAWEPGTGTQGLPGQDLCCAVMSWVTVLGQQSADLHAPSSAKKEKGYWLILCHILKTMMASQTEGLLSLHCIILWGFLSICQSFAFKLNYINLSSEYLSTSLIMEVIFVCVA